MPTGPNPAHPTGTNKEIPREPDPAHAEMAHQTRRRAYGGGMESQGSLGFLQIYTSIAVSNA